MINIVYNIGGGSTHSICTKKGVRYGDWRPGDQPVYISDIAKAERELNWKPAVVVEGNRAAGALGRGESGNLLVPPGKKFGTYIVGRKAAPTCVAQFGGRIYDSG